MPNERVRYAVIGAGNIAQVAVLPAFAHARENSELGAIISHDAMKRQKLSERYQLEHTGTYDELERVFADAHIDAAYIALPNHLHRSFTERCAAAGVHVLCEKPMAMTVEDCEAMVESCARADVRLMIAYRLHFEELTLKAIAAVREGTIGDPRFFGSLFSHQVRDGDVRTLASAGGGALYDLGVYCVNAARNLFGAEPIEVFGRRSFGADARFREVDEMTTAILRFPDDRLASFTCNQGASDVSELRIVGTRGDIRMDPAYSYAQGLALATTVDEKTEEQEAPKRDQFSPELVRFSQYVIDGVEPEPSGEEGLCDVRVLEAIVRSDELSHPVALAPYQRAQRPETDQAMKKRGLQKPATVHAPSPSR